MLIKTKHLYSKYDFCFHNDYNYNTWYEELDDKTF